MIKTGAHMKNLGNILILFLMGMTLCLPAKAANDIYAPDFTQVASLQSSAFVSSHYTLLNKTTYKNTVSASRNRVQQLLEILKPYRKTNTNTQVALIVRELADIPYMHVGAMGEGDWQPSSLNYEPGAIHINQNPVYRFDGLNCQTFVQIAMALIHSKNLDEFDNNILKIAYGAAGNPDGDIVRFFNRNNFTDADFNPVNHRNGWLTDVTSQGPLAEYAKTMTATITRQRWFLYQQRNLAKNVQVLSHSTGRAMVNRLETVYENLNFPGFDSEDIAISYLPKEWIASKQRNGGFQPNQELLAKIPTPAIAEIVRDPRKWNYFRIKIKDIIGSETTISHLGLLYRKTFRLGELIYQKTTCEVTAEKEKICQVTPITCQRKQCNELMFAHATDSLPIGYYWYQMGNGQYTCSPEKPAKGTHYTLCNRIVALPFFDYLTDYQQGYYSSMDLHSIVGVHIEKL